VVVLGSSKQSVGPAPSVSRHQLDERDLPHHSGGWSTHHHHRDGSHDEIPRRRCEYGRRGRVRIGSAYDSFARFSGASWWIVVSFILLSTSVELGLVVYLACQFLVHSLSFDEAASSDAGRSARGGRSPRGARIDTWPTAHLARVVARTSSLRTTVPRAKGCGSRHAHCLAQAGLESGQVLLPAILTGIVTFLGARDVMNGTLQAGQLVAFFGYSMFLTTPLRTALTSDPATRAMVGAGKVLRVLAIQPTVSDPTNPVAWPLRIVRLEDRRSGLVLEPGQLCAMVTDLPRRQPRKLIDSGASAPTTRRLRQWRSDW